MSHLRVNPDAQHPLYTGAMTLSGVHPGVEFITLDTIRGNFRSTLLVSGWRAEVVPIISSLGFPLASIIHLRANGADQSAIDLYEKGIHPPVEANDRWNMGSFSVPVTRESILALYPWLVKHGFARAANELESSFFNYFVDPEAYWRQIMGFSS